MTLNPFIKMVSNFRDALTTRGVLPAYTMLKQDIEDAEYPLQELQQYFESGPTKTFNDRDAYIFVYYVKHQIELLQKAAAEIDRDYQESVP